MKKQIINKGVSLFLIICIVASFFQISAYANEEIEQVIEEVGDIASDDISNIEEEQDLLSNDGTLDQAGVNDSEESVGDFQGIFEITSDTNQNYPIIIIPGVMGSNLYSSQTTFIRRNRVWAPDISNNILDIGMVFCIGSNMRMRNTLFPRPMANMNAPGAHREYGALSEYRVLVNYFIDVFPDREIFFFAYDFRLDNGVNASILNEGISQILADSHYDQVDIVAHSMGGLVTSGYVAQYGTGSVRNIVSLGAPYEGAPELFSRVLNGEISGNWIGDVALRFLGGMSPDVKLEFPSVPQLIPTEAYFNEHPFNQFSHTTGIIFRTRHYREMSHAAYVNISDSLFRWGTRRHFQEALTFHESIREDGIGILANYEHAYFVIGINQPTVRSVTFDDSGIFRNLPRVSDLSFEIYGDGTVPYDSQTMMRQLNGIERANERVRRFDVGHREMVSYGHVLTWVVDILTGNAATTEIQDMQPLSRGLTVLRIEGFADVIIEASEGVLSSEDSEISTIAPFGRLDLIGYEGEIMMLALIDWEDHEVTLNVIGDGTIDYTIRWFDDENNLLDERIFVDIPVNENAIITTNTARDEIIILEIDSNGDGTIDERWEAEENEVGSHEMVSSLIETDDFDNFEDSDVVELHYYTDNSERVGLVYGKCIERLRHLIKK